MPYTVEVKYFNSFWLKKVSGDTATGQATISKGSIPIPVWPGSPWNPLAVNSTNAAVPNGTMKYPFFPWGDPGLNLTPPITQTYRGCAVNTTFESWYVEEARIYGGYNNTNVSYGVRAYLAEDETLQQVRFNSIIYSGVYNSRTGFNATNVFSIGEAITKSADPADGAIQRLYAEDTNLNVFQEFKVSRALIDKDTIYTSEGGTQTQTAKTVVGQIVPYTGEWGIGTNPESLAVYGYRKYFLDRNKGAVLRLSNDGITEISAYGMVDYFRDYLSTITDAWQPISVDFTFPTPLSEGNNFQYVIDLTPGTDYTCADACKLKPGMRLLLNDGVSDIDTGITLTYVSDATPATPMAVFDKFFVIDGTGVIGDLTSSITTNIVGGTPGTYSGWVAETADWLTSGAGVGAYVTVVVGAGGTVTSAEVVIGADGGTGFAAADTITVNAAILGAGPLVITLTILNVTGIVYSGGKLVEYVKSKTPGGWDIHNKNYTLSMQPRGRLTCEPLGGQVYNTLGFDEQINGWVSLYTYQPVFMDSLSNRFYSFIDNSIYEHYDDTTLDNRGSFYGTQSDSSITFIFNPEVSISKNFLTINYEGSNGWEVNAFQSDLEEPNQLAPTTIPPGTTWKDNQDITNAIHSYEGGAYVENGVTYRAGFNRRENKYVANLINNSSFRSGEVVGGSSMSGIKGYFATVKLSTDSVTQVGGMKELYAVSSTFVKSSY